MANSNDCNASRRNPKIQISAFLSGIGLSSASMAGFYINFTSHPGLANIFLCIACVACLGLLSFIFLGFRDEIILIFAPPFVCGILWLLALYTILMFYMFYIQFVFFAFGILVAFGATINVVEKLKLSCRVWRIPFYFCTFVLILSFEITTICSLRLAYFMLIDFLESYGFRFRWT